MCIIICSWKATPENPMWGSECTARARRGKAGKVQTAKPPTGNIRNIYFILLVWFLPNPSKASTKETPTCLHTMYAENQTKWLSEYSEYLRAELTIVSTSQTKHLIPCFQYEFDIQQYSTTPGGQCWGSDPQCRGRWKDWCYHDVGHETSIAMVKKYKRV